MSSPETQSPSDPPNEPESPQGPEAERSSPADVIHRLAGCFKHKHFPTGDLAELRRLDPRRGTRTAGAAFWRIVAQDLEPAGLVRDEEALKRWTALLQGLATVYAFHSSKAEHRLGAAMAVAGISEARLVRLLQARGDALLAQLRPLAHQLHTRAQKVNWADVAGLVLSDGRESGDRVRQGVARAYYRRQHREEKEQQQTRAASA